MPASITGERIRLRRKQLGISADKLADLVGVSRATIYRYENGDIERAPANLLPLFAEELCVSVAYLLGLTDDPTLTDTDPTERRLDNIIPMPATRELPLLGNIVCGEPILAEENLDGRVYSPEHIDADFALICKGDSMINARIFDGDIVYIRQQPRVDDDQIAAVLIGDEATLKRVRLYADHISLEPENPQYRPIVLWGEEMSSVRILGLAVAFTGPVQ